MVQKKENRKKTIDEGAEDAVRLSRALSVVIRRMYEKLGMTQAEFASKINFTRSSLSTVISGSAGDKRLWRFPVLVDAARQLNMPLSTIIASAEAFLDGRDALLAIEVAGTAPASNERLMTMIRLIKKAPKEFEDIMVSNDLAVIRQYCLFFYESYISGKIGDERAMSIIKRAVELSREYTAKDEFDDRPWWSFISEAYPANERS